MPSYYTGYDPMTAASQGLMAGYEFVDRIKSRKRQLDLEDQQLNMQRERDARAAQGQAFSQNLASRQDQRAQEDQDYERNRRPIEDRREDTTWDQAQAERDRAIRERDEARALLEGDTRDRLSTPATLSSIGNGQLPAASAPRPTVQPASQVAAPVAPAEVAAPVEAPAPRKFGGRGAAGGVGGPVSRIPPAKPAEAPAPPRTSGGRGATGMAAPKPRVDVSAPKAAAKTAGITRPIKVTDPRAVAAITAPTAQVRESGQVPETTNDEIRALTTMGTRLKGDRLSPEQINRLARGRALGIFSDETINNYAKYGTPIAPTRPTIQALGNGYAAVITDAGISMMHLPGDKGESAEGRSQARLIANDRLKQVEDGIRGLVLSGKITGEVDDGKITDGADIMHVNKFLQMVKREGGDITLRSGIPLYDPKTGALRLDQADPGEIAELIASYGEYDENEEQPTFFKGGKSLTEYTPQAGGEQIIDLTEYFK